eukprot:9629700-Heterocapsa_arctica.AAC.2
MLRWLSSDASGGMRFRALTHRFTVALAVSNWRPHVSLPSSSVPSSSSLAALIAAGPRRSRALALAALTLLLARVPTCDLLRLLGPNGGPQLEGDLAHNLHRRDRLRLLGQRVEPGSNGGPQPEGDLAHDLRRRSRLLLGQHVEPSADRRPQLEGDQRSRLLRGGLLHRRDLLEPGAKNLRERGVPGAHRQPQLECSMSIAAIEAVADRCDRNGF